VSIKSTKPRNESCQHEKKKGLNSEKIQKWKKSIRKQVTSLCQRNNVIIIGNDSEMRFDCRIDEKDLTSADRASADLLPSIEQLESKSTKTNLRFKIRSSQDSGDVTALTEFTRLLLKRRTRSSAVSTAGGFARALPVTGDRTWTADQLTAPTDSASSRSPARSRARRRSPSSTQFIRSSD
jgi:hypothetical protein